MQQRDEPSGGIRISEAGANRLSGFYVNKERKEFLQ